MDWKARLRERGVLISDGAWGTQLAARGLDAGASAELWNVENPDAVEAVARGYVEADSDVILTNSFGGSRWKLEKADLADRTAELNRAAAAISKRAAADRALVWASVGPTGEFVAPLGTKPREAFVACFAEQIAALAEGGADGIVIETMSALEEATAALQAACDVAPDLPVVVSLTFEHGMRGFATMMGVTPERAAEELTGAGADLVGSNCGNGVEAMIEVARKLRTKTDRPLWIKPNAGMPQLVDGETVFPATPEEMARGARDLKAAGAAVIGGCCGSTPAHIRAMAEAVRNPS